MNLINITEAEGLALMHSAGYKVGKGKAETTSFQYVDEKTKQTVTATVAIYRKSSGQVLVAYDAIENKWYREYSRDK